MYVGVYLNFRRTLPVDFHSWSLPRARLQAVVGRSLGWSDTVEECTIVTAVAGSSEKVSGSRTQFRVVEPLSRSDHQRPRIRHQAPSLLRGEERTFQDLVI